MQLLDFPEEILLTALSFLGLRDLLVFARTNRYAKKFYEGSIRLQYIAELEAAGCVDRALDAPRHHHPGDAENVDEFAASIRERLEYLRKREARWRSLDLLASAASVPLAHEADVSVYDLSGGVFAYGETARETDFKYVDLREISRRSKRVETPRKWLTGEREEEGAALGLLPPTDVPWESYPFEGKLADFGLSLQEHDLIALITVHCPEGDPAGSQTIKLHLNEFSTRRPHPLAKDPLIVLAEEPMNYLRPAPIIEICGDHVAILLNFPRAAPRAASPILESLYVYNWKTGKLLQHKKYEWSQASCLTFITPSLFVLLNITDNSLELIGVLTASGDVHGSWGLVRKLRFPDLIDGFKLYTASCRGDPSPVDTSPERTRSNLDNMDAASRHVPARRWGAAGYGISADPSRAIISFNLVIIREHTNIPAGPTVNFIVHRSELARLAAESQDHYRSENADAETPADDAVREMGWEDWGPDVTRWRLEVDNVEWVTTTAGQRQVFSGISADANWSSVIVVRDYNPYAVRRAKAMASGVHVDSRDGVKAADLEEEEEGFFEFDDAAGMIEGGFVEIMQTPEGFFFNAHVIDANEADAGEGANEGNLNDVFALDATTGFHHLEPLGDHLNPDDGDGDGNNAGDHAEHNDNVVNGDFDRNGDDGNTGPSLAVSQPTPLKLISVRVRDTAVEFGSRYYKRGSLRGGLPCVEYIVAGHDELYTGLLLDEERIIGYLEDHEGSEKMLQMTVFSMHS